MWQGILTCSRSSASGKVAAAVQPVSVLLGEVISGDVLLPQADVRSGNVQDSFCYIVTDLEASALHILPGTYTP